MSRLELLEQLAATIMLMGIKENELLEKWDYRKHRNFSDVRMAVGKGRQKGRGKFEWECTEIAYQLDKVLKAKSK